MSQDGLLCDSCYHYVEDDETGELYCECMGVMDQDDHEQFRASQYKKCPFYQYNDEYISVRKQN